MKIRKLIFLTITVAIPALFFMPGIKLGIDPAYAGSQCTCRFVGGDIAEGQTACIKTPKGMVLARCERVLNNTSWKMLGTPCPSSQLAPIDRSMMTASVSKLELTARTLPVFKD